tara:strand:+ start:4434 stop:5060 length:627 start_codon:yes stop_codon:yes gene_type:complete
MLFLAVTNIIGLLSVNDTTSASFMIIFGLLTSFFTKNMIVILGVSLLFTNVFFMYGRKIEGFDKKDDEETKDGKKNKKDKYKKGKKKTVEDESQKDGFGQRNVPSSTPASAPSAEFEEDEEIGSRVDYAATMEQAYDNLQGILGNGGMEKLTTETKGLIDQQKNLMKTLNDMQPMMKMAKDTMSGFNLDSMTKSLQNMGSMIGSLKGK